MANLQASTVTNGLYACYPLNGNATDTSGEGLHGTMSTTVTPSADRFGKADMALRFNGTSTYVRVADFAPNRSAFAACVWAKPDLKGPLLVPQDLISKHGNPLDTQLLVRRDRNGKYGVEWTIGNVSFDLDSPNVGAIEPSYTNWDFIVVQYTGSKLQFYVNNQLVREIDAIGQIAGCTHTLTFGAYASNPVSESFVGLLDDIRFYNRSLSPSEISELYNDNPARLSSLTVAGAHGTAEPGNGVHSITTGTTVFASVSSPVTEGATRYICTGGTVQDNEYMQVSLTNVTMTLTNNATLTWNWQTQYHLSAGVLGNGTITLVEPWQNEGTTVELTATAATGWFFSGWTGDTNGCAMSGSSITVPMTGALSIQAVFSSNFPPSLADGLLAYYPLNGSATDTSGGKAHGTMTPGVTPAVDRFGQADMALRFSGSTSYVRVASFQQSRGTFAACVWAKPDLKGPLLAPQDLISKHGNPLDTQLLVRRDLNGKYGVEWSIGNVSFDLDSPNEGSIEPSYTKWDFIVVQYTGSKLQFYVNNQLMRENDASGLIAVCPHTLTFGAYASNPEIEKFVGLMDDIRFYNRALSPSEISDLYDGYTKTLTVRGAEGPAVPSNGVHVYVNGMSIDSSVASPVTQENMRRLCTGATVEGNACTQAGATNVTLTLTNNATLTWNWQTQYRLTTQTEGEGAVSAADGWQNEGARVALTATAGPGWFFAGWEGDAGDCVLQGQTITVPMTRARSIQALFIKVINMTFAEFAAQPGNLALKYKQLSGLWRYSNELGGLTCDSPANKSGAAFQISVNGPGLVSFEAELSGADGTNAILCMAGSQTHDLTFTRTAQNVSLAIPAGPQRIQWLVQRGAKSPEVTGIIRNIRWTPLAEASEPVPANGQTILRRNFAGLAWSGECDYYKAYAGLTPSAMKPVGTGVFVNVPIPAAALEALTAEAFGNPIYWRIDAVRCDTFGVEAVKRGSVWKVAVLPQGVPEFEAGRFANAELTVGVQCDVGPLVVDRGLEGQMACRVDTGALPPGLRLSVQSGAVGVSGVPTRAGHYQAMLQLTLRSNTKTVRGTSLLLDIVVTALENAAGDFDGWADGSIYGEGSARLSVTPLGHITGKLSMRGTNYTFKASNFNAMTNGCCTVKTVASHGAKTAIPIQFSIDKSGAVTAGFVDEPEAELVFVRNSWKASGRAEVLNQVAGVYPVEVPEITSTRSVSSGGGLVTLAVSSDGAVRLTGMLPGGTPVLSSGTLLLVQRRETPPDRFVVVVYGTFPGTRSLYRSIFGVFEIIVGANAGERNLLTEVIPLRVW